MTANAREIVIRPPAKERGKKGEIGTRAKPQVFIDGKSISYIVRAKGAKPFFTYYLPYASYSSVEEMARATAMSVPPCSDDQTMTCPFQ